MFKKAFKKNRIFRIGYSFLFAVQIPYNFGGCSSARCSNCGEKAPYCHQICRKCKLPFVGPIGFPQLPAWKTMSSDGKKMLVEEIYCHKDNKGRITCVNVENIPLNLDELLKVEKLKFHDAMLFSSTHEISPQKIRSILLT